MFSISRAREHKGITQFLVDNEAFRYLALKMHNNKKKMMGGIENYLDEELLGKEKPKEPLHLNTTKRNTTKSTNNNKFDQKH